MFALAALLVSPAVALQPPGKSDARWVPPGAVIVVPQEGRLGGVGFPEGFSGGGFTQGFGGPAFGPGGFEIPSEPSPDTGETFVQGRRVLVLISPDGSKVYGWSQASGKMTPLPVDVPKEERGELQPIIGDDVAAVTVNGTIYAYGGSSGKWGSYQVGADEQVVGPSVGQDYVMVRSKQGFGMFSAETGTWGSVRYPQPANETEGDGSRNDTENDDGPEESTDRTE